MYAQNITVLTFVLGSFVASFILSHPSLAVSEVWKMIRYNKGRTLAVIIVAVLAALAFAEPLVQVRKGVTPLRSEKPNTFRVDIAFRVQEEAGDDAQERVVQVTESLPPQVTLVSGELAHKLTVKSVEVDSPATDGWNSLEYVVCADKVKFTLKNLTVDVIIRPTRFSVYASDKEDAEVITSEVSDVVTLRTAFPLPKATLFADFEYLTSCVYGIAIVLPLLFAMFFVKVCAARPKNIKTN